MASSTHQGTGLLQSLESLAGKYLTFKLGAEGYGIGILKVQEIIGMMPVTHVPRMPEFVRGVINLRGKVIPVIDLRLKFGMESRENTDRTCIIVMQVLRGTAQIVMGIIVDEVSEVLDVRSDQLDESPSFGTDVDTEFILGMGKIGDKVVMLLDADRVLTDGEAELLVTQTGDEQAARGPTSKGKSRKEAPLQRRNDREI